MSDEYGLDLILAEEIARARAAGGTEPDNGGESPETDDHENTFVYETTDKDASGSFYVTPEDAGMTVPGPGTLDTLLIVASSGQFAITVESGSAAVLEHDYSTLESNSAELSHVAAYERQDSKKVLSASEFPYRDMLSILISPKASVTFDRIRAVYTLEPGVSVDG